ncbi:ArsC/Spx/MgsR family protein [Actibacterium lipolyticum]|uniref:Regulatory protein Spx n=1 Tax=Actibacterium lipolyticum TaxID=1524263 RepID=A0A238JQI7_9RHOB|nr:ArsC/Spx/MgsR family protein [Actibacterium lipolyticum]SMX32948.1 Regulatory protein Spx [Actibacterium lipolyticum]
MRIYGLKNCDTCRKAMKTISNQGVDAAFVDVRADGVSPADLARFHAEFGEDLVNRRSTTWRGLSEEERLEDPIKLLSDHPALMKRPVIETGGRLFLGWGKDVQAAVLG